MTAIRSTTFLAVSLAFLALGCGSDDDERLETKRIPPPSTGPYVSVAVDNHFHDIHPETGIDIAADRPFIVRNEGSNLHNVTVPGTEIDEDLKPGEELELDPLGDFLEPGKYEVICQIHVDQGMTGELTVVEE